MQQCSAARDREQQRPEADEATRRCLETNNGSTRVSRAKIGDTSLTGCKRLGNGSDILFGYVTSSRLKRFLFLAVDFLCDYLWTPNFIRIRKRYLSMEDRRKYTKKSSN